MEVKQLQELTLPPTPRRAFIDAIESSSIFGQSPPMANGNSDRIVDFNGTHDIILFARKIVMAERINSKYRKPTYKPDTMVNLDRHMYLEHDECSSQRDVRWITCEGRALGLTYTPSSS